MPTTLNTRPDGPFAFADVEQVQRWNAVQWLIEYVEDNNDCNDAEWADWMSVEDIICTYQPAVDCEGNIKSYEAEPDKRVTICARGKQILEGCIMGGSEDAEEWMDAWAEDIYRVKSEAA